MPQRGGLDLGQGGETITTCFYAGIKCCDGSCCCSSTAAAAAATLYQQKTAQKSFVGWEIFFNCTSRRYIMHSAGCDGRWLRYFKTKWETNSDYIGTSSLWYGSFYKKGQKLVSYFKLISELKSRIFSHSHFFHIQITVQFFLKGFFC